MFISAVPFLESPLFFIKVHLYFQQSQFTWFRASKKRISIVECIEKYDGAQFISSQQIPFPLYSQKPIFLGIFPCNSRSTPRVSFHCVLVNPASTAASDALNLPAAKFHLLPVLENLAQRKPPEQSFHFCTCDGFFD